MVNIKQLKTEQRNPNTLNLDLMSSHEILTIMNQEDYNVLSAVKEAIGQIEKVVEASIGCIQSGGRLILVGAGTSGRLGILDAVECVPTFSTTDEVIGIIAGGDQAFVKAVEGAEDSKELAISELETLKLNDKDLVIGLAASGRTPYAIGAIEYAHQIGAKTASIACNKNAQISNYSDYPIEVDCGSEILTGSTRLKSGTAQKLILNMITTTSMIGIGKVYQNLMVDMKATNQKLVERSKHIVMEATGCDYQTAQAVLEQCDYHCKTAIVMILANCDANIAKDRLNKANGFVRNAIK